MFFSWQTHQVLQCKAVTRHCESYAGENASIVSGCRVMAFLLSPTVWNRMTAWMYQSSIQSKNIWYSAYCDEDGRRWGTRWQILDGKITIKADGGKLIELAKEGIVGRQRSNRLESTTSWLRNPNRDLQQKVGFLPIKVLPIFGSTVSRGAEDQRIS